jgi:hypothetical protein
VAISAEFNRREERLTDAQRAQLDQQRERDRADREALVRQQGEKRAERTEARFRQDQTRKEPVPVFGGIPGQQRPPQTQEDIDRSRANAERSVHQSETEELRKFDEVNKQREKDFLDKALGLERNRQARERDP